MLVSIGILAWNEEHTIAKTLDSLLNQSVFNSKNEWISQYRWEIIIIPNGCTDSTAEVCKKYINNNSVLSNNEHVSIKIYELEEPGKSNAWNYYIHNLSDKNADYILLLDADIEFNEAKTIEYTIQALNNDQHAVAAVDLPLKDAEKKHKKTLIESISTASSNVSITGPVGISGQFYCARSNELRNIWIPKGLPVEDGFIRAMLVTDCLRSDADENKIIRVTNASHYYGTLTSLKDIFKHEVRIVVGTAMNCYLIWDLLMFATDPDGPGAGVLIKNKQEKNPEWLKSLINNAVRNHGFWVLPRGMFFRRFGKIRNVKGMKKIQVSIISLIGFCLDLPVFIAANQRLKRGKAIGFW